MKCESCVDTRELNGRNKYIFTSAGRIYKCFFICFFFASRCFFAFFCFFCEREKFVGASFFFYFNFICFHFFFFFIIFNFYFCKRIAGCRWLGCRVMFRFGCLLLSFLLFLSCTSAACLSVSLHVRGSLLVFFFLCVCAGTHTTAGRTCCSAVVCSSCSRCGQLRVAAAASLRGNEEKEGRGSESAPWFSSPAGMLRGVWRYCFEAPHHHARGRGTEWKTSSFLCVCCCGCG
ncbi:hypothetical protein Tc00.1047053509777.21 [Trypanosoma cruzi]|uniref:Uncharacterized protein n=1 Tax=Trypanosoma cruzi (strain CL Brener) TaxID=353153 RepID=Q4DIN2_TRYCC|nr:hypothetical protein Tc00.1047053509777.21 [Trypanosoma cruzi]EAN92386.1 hypothetical protein Tc00.1047053509777.21 [Trypanosoma cruzi]|eukprot:XP_814237.1 hypothetical protein [Trypanosoma cruzi strain CL Brener]